ncbi:MAG: hypothetical protein ABIA78_03575 [archaeon]
MVKNKFYKRELLIVGIVIALVIISFFVYTGYISNEESFSVDTILLKSNIVLGEEVMSHIKIANNEDVEQDFSVSIYDNHGFISLDIDSFTLGVGEFKDIEVSLKDSLGVVGVYMGQLVIENSIMKKEIPVVLVVENFSPSFAVIQTGIPKYDNVYPGGKLGIEMKLVDISGVSTSTVYAEYHIQNFEGEMIWIGGSNLITDGSKIELINIPKGLPQGDYLFVTSIEYEDEKSVAGYLFTVSEKENRILSGSLKFFVIIILGFVVGVLVLFFYFIKTRDKLLIQLKSQQRSELRENLKLIRNSRMRLDRLKDVSLRKEKLAKLNKSGRELVSKIRIKQKRQREEFSKSRKTNKKIEMIRKIRRWKLEGYDLIREEKKKIAKEHFGKQVKDWGRKGYATGFLKKKKIYK